MTTVAWDGLTLAADRQCTNGNATFQVCKVSQCDRDGGYMLAFSGDADQGEEMVNWFTSGADPDKFPEKQRETNRFSPLVAIRSDGIILVYECTPYPIRLPPQKYAIGSGAAYALAAMHCGRNAVEAVEVACVFDPGSGLGVDSIQINQMDCKQ